jgi:hypothetical protein
MVLSQQRREALDSTSFRKRSFPVPPLSFSRSVAESRLSIADADICHTALEQLAKMFTVASEQVGSSGYVRQILLWMMVVPDTFTTLVQERVPEALCIFGYYCVLLKRLDSVWFMEGWSEDLIENIYYLLDDRYRGYIVWPMREIGWTPDVNLE